MKVTPAVIDGLHYRDLLCLTFRHDSASRLGEFLTYSDGAFKLAQDPDGVQLLDLEYVAGNHTWHPPGEKEIPRTYVFEVRRFLTHEELDGCKRLIAHVVECGGVVRHSEPFYNSAMALMHPHPQELRRAA